MRYRNPLETEQLLSNRHRTIMDHIKQISPEAVHTLLADFLVQRPCYES